MEADRPALPISVVADMIGVCEQTLRLWEKSGLLTPTRADKGSRRLYSLDDVERLELIKRLTSEAGINLLGVKKILEIFDSCVSRHCDRVKSCLKLHAEEK
jgi:MerR family transcriptional regulator, heat shock protein HspR